jgi:hypothetical protein
MYRCVLHDFYEPVCIELLKNAASGMGPTSRILIFDHVVPEKALLGADNTVYWMDFSMMTISGKEKTAKIFAEMFDAAGLEIVKIWTLPDRTHSCVEGKLKAT